MQCQHCQSPTKKFGRTPDGRQRFRCLTCRKISSERRERPLGDMRLPIERALQVLQLLVEGVSVRAVERLTGTEKRTILRLLCQVGAGCERMLAERVREVPVKDVECDEIWTFVRCKEATKARRGITDLEAGDCYTFIALERHSKLVLAFKVGRRSTWDAHDFMAKVNAATAGEFQISTDGWTGYPETIDYNLGAKVSYGMVVKEFGNVGGEEARRYAPPRLIGQERLRSTGSRMRTGWGPAGSNAPTGRSGRETFSRPGPACVSAPQTGSELISAAMLVIAGKGVAVATVREKAAVLAAVNRILADGRGPVGRVRVAMIHVLSRHPLDLVVRAGADVAIAIGAAKLA